jgi:hypothetical protein
MWVTVGWVDLVGCTEIRGVGGMSASGFQVAAKGGVVPDRPMTEPIRTVIDAPSVVVMRVCSVWYGVVPAGHHLASGQSRLPDSDPQSAVDEAGEPPACLRQAPDRSRLPTAEVGCHPEEAASGVQKMMLTKLASSPLASPQHPAEAGCWTVAHSVTSDSLEPVVEPVLTV